MSYGSFEQNLLRTLTESRLHTPPDANLKLLLTTVKEGRVSIHLNCCLCTLTELQRQSHDTKLADPFYESLEGLLHDLRTITIVCDRVSPASRVDEPLAG